MAGGGCHAVNAIHWHTESRGSTQREAGRQRTRRLVDIHINAKLSLCSAAMSPSWSPDRAAWSLRTRSFIFIPAHPLRPKLSWDVSKDVRRCPQNVFGCLLMFREVAETWGRSLEVHFESQNVEPEVKFGASKARAKTNESTLVRGFYPSSRSRWAALCPGDKFTGRRRTPSCRSVWTDRADR